MGVWFFFSSFFSKVLRPSFPPTCLSSSLQGFSSPSLPSHRHPIVPPSVSFHLHILRRHIFPLKILAPQLQSWCTTFLSPRKRATLKLIASSHLFVLHSSNQPYSTPLPGSRINVSLRALWVLGRWSGVELHKLNHHAHLHRYHHWRWALLRCLPCGLLYMSHELISSVIDESRMSIVLNADWNWIVSRCADGGGAGRVLRSRLFDGYHQGRWCWHWSQRISWRADWVPGRWCYDGGQIYLPSTRKVQRPNCQLTMSYSDAQVNNLVHSFRLQQTSFDKKSYLTYLKGYMKAIKTHLQTTNPDRVAVFEKAAADGAKKIVGNFKDFEFYIGEGMNPDGWVFWWTFFLLLRLNQLGNWVESHPIHQNGCSSQLPRGWCHPLLYLVSRLSISDSDWWTTRLSCVCMWTTVGRMDWRRSRFERKLMLCLARPHLRMVCLFPHTHELVVSYCFSG